VPDSDILRRGGDAVAWLDPPFGTGPRTPVLAPLVPDVAIVHADLCDPDGRAVFFPPYPDGHWGAKSAPRVIVTTERVVERGALREHAAFRQFPASKVVAVCAAPYGAHPYELLTANPDGGYATDSAALADYATALATVDGHRSWLAEHVLGRDEEGYRRLVGAARLAGLRERFVAGFAAGRAAPVEPGPPSIVEGVPAGRPLAELPPDDRIALVTARLIVAEVLERGATTLLVGNGLPHRASALARELLRRQGRSIELVIGTGTVEFDPRPADRPYQLGSAQWVTGALEAYRLGIGTTRSVAVLSTAQVDRAGNLNTTELVARRTTLAGSGGANDAATLADAVLVTSRYRRGRFVDTVDYVTCPGSTVDCLVSDFAVYRRSAAGALVPAAELVPGGAPAEGPQWTRSAGPVPVAPDADPDELSALAAVT
jgi:acyl CoA:acetate/3-ketoacid CoA transferase beta subunit